MKEIGRKGKKVPPKRVPCFFIVAYKCLKAGHLRCTLAKKLYVWHLQDCVSQHYLFICMRILTIALFLIAVGAGAYLFWRERKPAVSPFQHAAPTLAPNNPATGIAVTATLPVRTGSTFNDYWYQGKAELNNFDVKQERYGEERQAEQVMVFVTEDFSKQKQVKLDDPSKAGPDRCPILKLNTLRRFRTGIYDYSLMQSVFTPIDIRTQPRTLKMTCSVQDWCGQVFSQLNAMPTEYRLQSFSYFETENDSDHRIPLCLLEDELWVRLRLDPTLLPSGTVQLLPSAFYTRLRHQPSLPATADLTTQRNGAESTLQVVYKDIDRQLAIRYETNFPHRILGWEERDGGKMTSQGTLKATLMSAYWQQNGHAFDGMRDSLKRSF